MKAAHGGDVAAAARRWGRAAGELLDLSANVNPAGPPPRVRAVLRAASGRSAELAHYPDPSYAGLRAALARATGIPPAAIAIGNGSAALIGATLRALRPRRALLPVPAFSEYHKALADERIAVRFFPLAAPRFALDLARLAATVRRTRTDLVVLANPNNPTGVLIPRAALHAFVAGTPQATILVDEAFIDYAPDESLLAGRRPRNLVVLRSLTKFFAIPGVRAGYAVATPALARRIESMLPSWPVGALDAALAAAAPGDAAYEGRSRAANVRARARLAAGLAKLGITTVPGAANFLLCDLRAVWRGTPAALAGRLARDAGILVRTFGGDPVLQTGCWVRVAVRTPREGRRLVTALAAILDA